MSNIRRSMMMRKKGCKILYEASNLVFDGTGGIDTGVKLFESDIDFEIDCEISNVKYDYEASIIAYVIWYIVNETVNQPPKPNVGFTQRYNTKTETYNWWDCREGPVVSGGIGNYVGNVDRLLTIKRGRTITQRMFYQGNQVYTHTCTLGDFVQSSSTLVLGSGFRRHAWFANVIGTINHIIVKQL